MASCSQSWPWDLYVAEDNPELFIFLLLLCEFWDYRGTLPHYLVHVLLEIEPKFHACQASPLLSYISSSLWNFTVNKNIWMLRKIMFFFKKHGCTPTPPPPSLYPYPVSHFRIMSTVKGPASEHLGNFIQILIAGLKYTQMWQSCMDY